MKPPITLPVEPTPNDLGTGGKVSFASISAILAGAVPLTPEDYPAGTVDTRAFAPCPPGVRRVVVRGAAYDDVVGSLLIWYLVKADGTACPLDIQAGQYNGLTFSTANIRPVTLGAGEFVQATDVYATGGNVYAGIGYVDVEVV